MKYLMRIAISLMVILLVACAYKPSPSELVKSKKTVALQSIKQISAKGPFDLTVVFGASHNRLQLVGAHYLVNHFDYRLNDSKQLFLSLSSRYAASHPLQVTLYVASRRFAAATFENLTRVNIKPQRIVAIGDLSVKNVRQTCLCGKMAITSLNVHGSGTLVGKGDIRIKSLYDDGNSTVSLKSIRSSKMTVQNIGSGRITLRGYVDVDQVYQAGTGQLDLYWLNSSESVVTEAEQGKVTLAGKSKKIVANLSDSSFLNAEYLRAKTVYVKTVQNALAHVKASQYLFADANDYSQINYYEEPAHLYRQTDKAGVVLPMF